MKTILNHRIFDGLYNAKGFVIKIFATLAALGAIVYFSISFFLVYDASTIRQKMEKLDGQPLFISGKVVEARYFKEVPTIGAGYFGMKLKTRKGEIWVVTLKDKPPIGGKYFMEVEVLGSIDTVNKRLQANPPFQKNSPFKMNVLPILIEKTRIGMPFIF